MFRLYSKSRQNTVQELKIEDNTKGVRNNIIFKNRLSLQTMYSYYNVKNVTGAGLTTVEIASVTST